MIINRCCLLILLRIIFKTISDLTDAFKILEGELKNRLEIQNLPKRNNEQIIKGIIATSNKEFTKKTKDKNFYICHTLYIFYVIKQIFKENFYDTLKIAASDKNTNFLANGYKQILRWILLDIKDLCNRYSSSNEILLSTHT